MKNIMISYNLSAVSQAYIDELRAAFSSLGCNAEFMENIQFRNSLRVLAYKSPPERDYVFSPYPALESGINSSPRGIDVLFDGRLSDPDKMKDAWRGLSGRIYELCLRVAETLEGSRLEFDAAVDEALFDMGCLSELPANSREYLVTQISFFMAALNGFNMLNTLLDAGIKVSYCGPRSYCSLYKHPNLIKEKEMRPAKILVYAHPFLAYGASQPTLSAMGSGTVVATDANGFMIDNFPEMIIYRSDNFAESVTQLLEHPAELTALSEVAREKVLSGHMPRHRAEKILLALKLSGLSEVSLYG